MIRIGSLTSRLGLALAVLLAGAALSIGPASGGVRSEVSPCRSRVSDGVLPLWARAGFSEAKLRIAHVMSAGGKMTAILFADPLRSPPPRDHNNKILWVERTPTSYGSDLWISAQRMSGTTRIGQPLGRRVIGGPGPSIINLPAAGCWRLSLRWSGQLDSIDLDYTANP